jgi:hypothetical protein
MMSEFAAYYGVPDGSLAWPLFLALHRRTPLFEARRRLTALLGTAGAIGAAFSGDDGTVADMMSQAYPVKVTTPRMIENLASRKNDGGANGS